MPLQTSTGRTQIEFFCMEQLIGADNPVRVIEAFVEGLDLEEMGFLTPGKSREGRPAFSSKTLLKLYLYGYQHGIRSSRKLEAECVRNVEVWWLLGRQAPGYKTISDFRKDNRRAFKAVFRKLVGMLKEWKLIGGNTLAVDSVKIRAQNSKKNNFTSEKIERQIAYIDRRLEEFFEEMDQLDQQDSLAEQTRQDWKQVSEKVQTHMDRRDNYERLGTQLKQSGQTQISTTDPDARALPLHRNIVEVGYSVQTAVDDTHKLVVHNEVTNANDINALSHTALEGKKACGADQIDVLGDAGYHTGKEIAACEKEGIVTFVAAGKHAAQTHEEFTTDKFEYVPQGHYYICPQGYELHTNGQWYERKNSRSPAPEVQYRIQQFKTPACMSCPVRSQCTKAKYGRMIERSEFQDATDANDKRVRERRDYYSKRQAIVEHPFGTVKRQWGFTYTLLKTIPKVQAETDLIFTCYNLTRCLNILGVKGLLERIQAFFGLILGLLRRFSGLLPPIFQIRASIVRFALVFLPELAYVREVFSQTPVLGNY
ncbi:MAG: IS1182 family transposase [Saprospiraceae bacterium]